MRRGALISFCFHLAIVLAAIIALPTMKLDNSSDDSVSVDLVGPSVPQQGRQPGKTPAPDTTPVVNNSPQAEQKPKPTPFEAPPPPPPPPPPAQEVKQPVLPQPPAPAPPPPPPVETPSVAPTPPPPPPAPPQKTTSTVVQPKLPLPPLPQPPAPTPPTPTHQQHVVKTATPLSKSVLNTLLKLEAQQKQTKAPTHEYNPDQGGAPDAGGSTQSTANSRLSGADRNAIGNHVRPCWTVDAGAPGLAGFSVNLTVQTDASGTVHNAVVSPQDQSKMGDPLFNAFAQRAVAAVMNYQCATLPLPSYMLGHNQTFSFDFTP